MNLSVPVSVSVSNKGLCSSTREHSEHHMGRNEGYFTEVFSLSGDEVITNDPADPDNNHAIKQCLYVASSIIGGYLL